MSEQEPEIPPPPDHPPEVPGEPGNGATSVSNNDVSGWHRWRHHRRAVIGLIAAGVACAVGIPVAFAATSSSGPSASWTDFNTQGQRIGDFMDANPIDTSSGDLSQACDVFRQLKPMVDVWQSPDAQINHQISDMSNEFASLIQDGCGTNINFQGLLSDAAGLLSTAKNMQTRINAVDPDPGTWNFDNITGSAPSDTPSYDPFAPTPYPTDSTGQFDPNAPYPYPSGND